eukprot:1896497-Amphidinium_carterae.2
MLLRGHPLSDGLGQELVGTRIDCKASLATTTTTYWLSAFSHPLTWSGRPTPPAVHGSNKLLLGCYASDSHAVPATL